eukprot:evm.model.scf_4977.1 EVM.evm.TU.scf_4977.1   scf_4977:1687-3797(-)
MERLKMSVRGASNQHFQAPFRWAIRGHRVSRAGLAGQHRRAVGGAVRRTRLAKALAAANTDTTRIIIQGRRMEVTPAIKTYVEKKVYKAVEHFESQVKEVDVSLSVRGGDTGTKGNKEQKSEVTVHTLRNGTVRAEVVEDNLYASVDLVCDKVQRMLRKVKEKAILKGKWPGGGGPKGGLKVGEVLNPDGEPPPLDKSPKMGQDIVRVKYFQLEPMNEQEAIEEMLRLDHDFHVYEDKKTNKIQVVYKRQERGYGLLIPMQGEGKSD